MIHDDDDKLMMVMLDFEFETQTDDKRAPDVVPKEADVVIIGGGSVGASTLYHLTKLGVRNAILLERDQLTSGTTWHSAGLVWRLRPSDVEVELLAWTRKLAKDILEQETGLWSGWNENGGLFIANNKERLDEYKRLMTVSFSSSVCTEEKLSRE